MDNAHYKDLYEKMERAYANEARKNVILQHNNAELRQLLAKTHAALNESYRIVEQMGQHMEDIMPPNAKDAMQ